MLAVSKEQYKIEVSEQCFVDLLDRWVIAELQPNRFMFIKHFFALNPWRKRKMLMQLFISGFPNGKFMEGVFEAHARMPYWVSQVEVNGIPYPKLALQNGCFDVLELDIDNKRRYVTTRDLGQSKFFQVLVENKFASQKELDDITLQGISCQNDWIQVLL